MTYVPSYQPESLWILFFID